MENVRELSIALLVSVGNAIHTNVFTSSIISKLIDNQSDDKLRDGVIFGNAADFFCDVVIGEELYERAFGYVVNADEFSYEEFREFVHSDKFQDLYHKLRYNNWITPMVGLATYSASVLRDAMHDAMFDFRVPKTSTDLTEEQANRCNRVMQNAIEIAVQYYGKLQEKIVATDMVAQTIQRWSWEAENAWEDPNCEENTNEEYLDFIDKFAERKYMEFLTENGFADEDAKNVRKTAIPDEPIDCISKVTKRAKLVTFEVCARVVVPDDDNNTAMEQAIEDIRCDAEEYIHEDNIVSVEDDKSRPIKLAQEYIIITADKKALCFQTDPYNVVIYGDYKEAKTDFSPANDLTIATLVFDGDECYIFVNGNEVGKFEYNEYTQNKVNGIVKSNFQYKLQNFVETHDFSKYLA